MINGHATPTGTTQYAKKHSVLSYHELSDTGLHVSQAGFGCYRVDVQVEEHRDALRKALRTGINLIDTSSNYMHGGSEELVGTVLAELIAAGEITREEVVVVSKVGYLQGPNYQLSQQRKQQGQPFPDLVLYGEGLEHCIHPEFLEDQLTRSLNRLQLQTLDGYLLHNPEYFLGLAKKANMPLAEARTEYLRRIELAFRHLEAEVARGRIRCYGISSNTFPASANDPQFTSLESVLQIAESISPQHHFKIIQLPMNLFETGGVTERNQAQGQSVLAVAERKKIGVLINRPLNALVGNAITRLADGPVVDDALVASISDRLAELVSLETHFKQETLPQMDVSEQVKGTVADKLSAGELLSQHGRSFSSLEHWNEVLSQFLVPTVQQAVQLLLQHESSQQELAAWVESYVNKVNGALQALTAFYQQQSAERTQAIKAQVVVADSEWGQAETLSQMALRALRSTSGITTVLVGMRRSAYVEDVVHELSQPVETTDRTSSWEALNKTLR